MALQSPSPLVGPPPRRAPRRSRMLHRLVPLLAFAALAFGAGIVLGSRHEPSERRLVDRFASAWERGDHATMHSLLTADARREHPLRRFRRAYERAAETATLASVRTAAATGVGRPRRRFRRAHARAAAPATLASVRTSAATVLGDGKVGLDVRLATRIFGSIGGRLTLEVEEDADGTAGIAWRPEQVFPGLRAGERLRRETRMPPRAALQARD